MSGQLAFGLDFEQPFCHAIPYARRRRGLVHHIHSAEYTLVGADMLSRGRIMLGVI